MSLNKWNAKPESVHGNNFYFQLIKSFWNDGRFFGTQYKRKVVKTYMYYDCSIDTILWGSILKETTIP